MRRDCSHLFRIMSIVLLFSTLSFGQAWSGILAPSRAINWSNAGLPATLPDGETTPNPWTPPTRTQCTAYSGYPSAVSGTGTAATDVAAINNALTACAGQPGTYIPITGTFNISGSNNCFGGGTTCIQMYAQNGLTLRGSGPQSTTLDLTGNAEIAMGIQWNNESCTWSSGFSAGTTSITLTRCTVQPVVGQLLHLTQCDSGYSGPVGAPCTTGSTFDNGGLYICGFNLACMYQTSPSTAKAQQQVVYPSVITGTCSSSCTVTISPGLYMANWNATINGQNATPQAIWTTSCSASNCATTWGNGLEDMTIYTSSSTVANSIVMQNAYASWVKGVRFIGTPTDATPVSVAGTKNSLLFNNYIFADYALDGSLTSTQIVNNTSDSLFLNNILTSGAGYNGFGSNEGNVFAYEYNRDSTTSFYQNNIFEHHPGAAFELMEGNESGEMTDDDTWGTHTMDTWFRNYVSGGDSPLIACGGGCNPRGMVVEAYARFDNLIGNAIGSSLITLYQNGGNGSAFIINSNSTTNDPLTLSSLMRWGNCDTATATCRFQSSEVPTSLSGNAAPFENSVPSNDNLPCSFFLSSYSSSPCTPTYSGGTGLSWWKVCTSWTTFPTSCATTRTPPFPFAGPELTSGPYVNGNAYDNPAEVAYANLPIDSAYQHSYTITRSSWAGGAETLTVTGLPGGGVHITGGFQITGAPSACVPTSGVSDTGRSDNEILMTASSGTTVSYSLPSVSSDPGCTGTMKFPDVRKFDESVYQNDPNGDPPPPAPPTGLNAQVD